MEEKPNPENNMKKQLQVAQNAEENLRRNATKLLIPRKHKELVEENMEVNIFKIY